jgi:hypothetical protein
MSATRRSVLRGLAAIAAAAASPAALAATAPPAPTTRGHFVGTVIAQWGDDGLDMVLMQPFEFVGPDGQRWPVPAGARVNGASIPRVFWSVIGGPFDGLYRNASVVHDYYCGVQSRSYKAVHKVFYDAMIASGVGPSTAWLMFEAVNRFGPRWADLPAGGGGCGIQTSSGDGPPCTRSIQPRALRAARPKKIEKDDLESFLSEVQSNADPKDVAKLRKEIKNLPQ